MTEKNKPPVDSVPLNKELIAQGVELGLGKFEDLAKLEENVLAEKINKKLDELAEEEVMQGEKEKATEEIKETKKKGEAAIKEQAKEDKALIKKADEFVVDTYIDVITIMDEGNQVPKEKLKDKYRSIKGKVRAARAFNVSIDHLTKAYKALNGKKVDGFYATDLIDRYGFNGQPVNRADVARKYGKTSVMGVEVAEEKLKLIISYVNVLAAYGAYMKDIKAELDRGLEETTLFGE